MIRVSKGILHLALCAAAASPLAWAATARAETTTPAAAPAEVDEVVVTARKRAETAHDAPLTVSVVNGDALRAMPIASAQDLNGAVPGLALQVAIGNLTSATFRGLGSNSALYSVESSVALFIDGVYMGHPRGYATPIYDLDHIEMIKGTQATLLGKNTSVGAISEFTHRPSMGFDYQLASTYEFEFRSPRLEGFLNVPVSDQLAVRMAGLFDRDGGYYTNAFSGRGEGQTDNASGRISALWTPNTSIDVTASYQHDHRIQWGQYMEVLRDASAGATLANRALLVGQTNFEAQPNFENADASFAIGSVPGGPPTKDKQVGDRFNLVGNWRTGGYTLTSQTAYVGYDVLRSNDIDFTSAHLLDLIDNERDRQFTQELRLASPAGARLEYLVGAYYLQESWSLDRIEAGFSPAPGVFPLTGATTQYFTQKTRAGSLFAHADLHLTDKLTASGGVRYTSEQKRGFYFRPPGTGLIGASFPAIPSSVVKVSDDTVDGDAGLQYRPDPDLMLYGSWSKGSKSGGLQNMPATLAGAPYSGETAYTVEVGAKKRFAGRGDVDVALFDTKVDNYQFTRIALVGGVNQSVVANVNIEGKGAEFNAGWRLDGGVRATMGLVYSDVKALQTVPGPPAIPAIVSGLRMPRAPKLTGNFALDDERPLGHDLSLALHAELQYSSPMYLQPNFGASLDAPHRSAYTMLNLRAALINDPRGWELALIGKNVTDVKTPIFATPIPGTGIPGTNTVAWAGTLMEPRQIALQFTIRR